MTEITVVNSGKNWMESNALRQLESVATYEGVTRVVGLPDLHAGRTPVGLVVISQNHVYPWLVGGDIGCGMALYQTIISYKKFKPDKWESKLVKLTRLSEAPLDHEWPDSPISDLGTIGGGNHFIEAQTVENVLNPAVFETLGLEPDKILLLVHTGSRNFGGEVLASFEAENGYPLEDPKALAYMDRHDEALIWAFRNRELAAERFLDYLGFGGQKLVMDLPHNYIERSGSFFIHRKGAVSAKHPLVIIPGSRGTLTYLVKPSEDTSVSADSLSHGAGRKWARSYCRGRLDKKYDKVSLKKTTLKSRVICHDLDLLFQEAPEAYKNIAEVINVLVEFGLVEIVATLRPLLTYKG